MERTCTNCKTLKPLDGFPRDKRGPGGLSYRCKDCHKIKNQVNYAKHAEKRRAYATSYQQEHREIRSDYNKAYRDKNREELIAYARNWRASGNKTNRSEASRAYAREYNRIRYATDPEYRARLKEYGRTYRKNNTDKVLSAGKTWRAKNIDHARKHARERQRAFSATPEGKKYLASVRLKYRAQRQASTAAYYAKRYGESGVITNQHLVWLHKWQDHCCCYCNAPLKARETIEHVVPLSRGGENNPHNVLLACGACNYGKNNRLFDESEWLPEHVVSSTRVHSLIGTAAAATHLGLPFVKESAFLDLGSAPLFVLSTFWISDRAPAPISVVDLRQQYPTALLTFDYEWIQHPQALLNIAMAKAGQSESIGARQLDVESPTTDEARTFMDTWHAQGFAGGSWYLGLRHPVTRAWHGMASFRRAGTDYELARLAFRGHVSGGVSRLTSTFMRTAIDPGDLWTYADTRFGEGLGYVSAGFEPAGETDGWYGYANSVGMRSRQAYRKDKMAAALDWFDPNWTERRLAKTNGLWRVDGLPQRRYVLRK